LSPAGVAALTATRAGELTGLALTPDLVRPAAATFLGRCWEMWWESQGVNLAIGSGCESSAVAGLDDLWQQFHPGVCRDKKAAESRPPRNSSSGNP
jgi:hypothetical protein